MKRWIIRSGTEGLDGLIQQEVPAPEPDIGEVRVRVRAVSFNRRDQMALDRHRIRIGAPDLVPLNDGAGVIDAVGPGASRWAVGDKVVSQFFRNWIYGPRGSEAGQGLGSGDEDGMLAQQVVLAADRVVRMPATLDYAEAATLPCAGLTAWNALHGRLAPRPGSRVLIMGSGGVSLLALMFARAAGASVIATTGQTFKVDRLRALGASDVIDYRGDPQWGETVFARTGGVDTVVEVGGIGSLNQAIAALRSGGEIAMVGFLEPGEAVPDLRRLIDKSASIRGVSVGNIEMFAAMRRAIDGSGLKPLIGQRFDFDQVKEAYRAQQSPAMFGKIVVVL